MSSAQIAAVRRLLVIVLAWAAVETIFVLMGQRGLATVAGAAAGALAFYLTRNAVLKRRKRGDVIYWRGRAIDREDLN